MIRTIENFEFNVGFDTRGGQAFYEIVQGITNLQNNEKIKQDIESIKQALYNSI